MFEKLLNARIKDLWNFYEATGELSHPGEKGILREAFLRRLMETLLPTHFGIGSGIIVDRWSKQSSQTDLLVYDKRLLPPLFEQNGHGIYPIDAVLRVLEVKSILDKDGLAQFKKASWLLHPNNPFGLKLASRGKLQAGHSFYPLVGLYAYDTKLSDVSSASGEISGFGEFDSLCCIAQRGIYTGPDLMHARQGDLVQNTIHFFALFLDMIEMAASSRKEFSLNEWLLNP